MVAKLMHEDPYSGSLFLFRSRRGDHEELRQLNLMLAMRTHLSSPRTRQLPIVCPHCGGTRFCQRGEGLEYVPARYKIVVYVRPRMICRLCEKMVQVPMPAPPIQRGRPEPGPASNEAGHLTAN